jgi:hypothetical protein
MDPSMYGALMPGLQLAPGAPQGLGMAPMPQQGAPQEPDYNAILGRLIQQHLADQQSEAMQHMAEMQQNMQQQPQAMPVSQMQHAPPTAFGAQPAQPLQMRPPTPPTQPANQAMLPMHANRYTGGPGGPY